MKTLGFWTRLAALVGCRQQGLYRLEDTAVVASSNKKHSSTNIDISVSSSSTAAEGKKGRSSNKKNSNSKTKKTNSSNKSRADRFFKYLSLAVLIIQTATHVLFVRYASSRNVQVPFLKTVVVFYNEVIKLVAALILYFLLTGSPRKSIPLLYEHFFVRWLDLLKLTVPALAYTVQTVLLYIALEHLDAGTYSVTYQLKILTTAFFTVILLKRRLSAVQWLSLLILLAGVAIVQISAEQKQTSNKPPVLATNVTKLIKLKNALNTTALEENALERQKKNVSIELFQPQQQQHFAQLGNLARQMDGEADANEPVLNKSAPLNQRLVVEVLLNSTVQQGANGGGGRGRGNNNNNNGVAGGILLQGAAVAAAELPTPKAQQTAAGGGAGHQQSSRKQSPIIGLLSVLAACFLSGFSGVYIEKLLKQSRDVSVWLQNVQLSALAIPISLACVAVQDGQKVLAAGGLNQGFDSVVWGVVLLQSLGGLVTAIVIKYADNILKAFANSFAIIVISLASIFLFQLFPTRLFIGGASLVICSLILYSLFPYKKQQKQSSTASNGSISDDSTEVGMECGGGDKGGEKGGEDGGGLPTKENSEEEDVMEEATVKKY